MASDDLHIMSYDAVMARIGANVHATTSDLDLTNVVVLFNSPGRVPSESWMLALILRYCEDVGASDTPGASMTWATRCHHRRLTLTRSSTPQTCLAKLSRVSRGYLP